MPDHLDARCSTLRTVSRAPAAGLMVALSTPRHECGGCDPRLLEAFGRDADCPGWKQHQVDLGKRMEVANG